MASVTSGYVIVAEHNETERRLKDLCVTLHNAVQNWRNLIKDGCNSMLIIKRIGLNCDTLKTVETTFIKLKRTLTQMEHELVLMKSTKDKLSALRHLDERRSVGFTSYLGWNLATFEKHFDDIVTQCSVELQQKRLLASRICHVAGPVATAVIRDWADSTLISIPVASLVTSHQLAKQSNSFAALVALKCNLDFALTALLTASGVIGCSQSTKKPSIRNNNSPLNE